MKNAQRLIVQADWEFSLREHSTSSIWVIFQQTGSSKIYSKFVGPDLLAASTNFSAQRKSPDTLSVGFKDETTDYISDFRAPNQIFNKIHVSKKSIKCVDVTVDGLGMSCDTAGNLLLWQTSDGLLRRTLGDGTPSGGHVGDVYTCRFFPSGIVGLSGGADTRLLVWDLPTGRPVASLIGGHTQGINDTAIIDRGCDVISCSADGTAKVFNVAQSKCVSTFEPSIGSLTSCSLASGDKMLLLTGTNGSLCGYDTSSVKEKVLSAQTGDSALLCCCLLSDGNTVICGAENSTLSAFDLRDTRSPLFASRESRGPLLSLTPLSAAATDAVCVSAGDGSCFTFNSRFTPTSLEFTGPDCDAVYSLACDSSHLFTACRDGLIRKYRLRDIQ